MSAAFCRTGETISVICAVGEGLGGTPVGSASLQLATLPRRIVEVPGSDCNTAEEFGRRLYREAGKRGWNRAQKKVVMGDGAEWIWNLVAEHFPGAMPIVDLYHARQHLWDLARRLCPNDEGKQKGWIKLHQKRLLDRGKIEKLVGALRALKSRHSEVSEKARALDSQVDRTF